MARVGAVLRRRPRSTDRAASDARSARGHSRGPAGAHAGWVERARIRARPSPAMVKSGRSQLARTARRFSAAHAAGGLGLRRRLGSTTRPDLPESAGISDHTSIARDRMTMRFPALGQTHPRRPGRRAGVWRGRRARGGVQAAHRRSPGRSPVAASPCRARLPQPARPASDGGEPRGGMLRFADLSAEVSNTRSLPGTPQPCPETPKTPRPSADRKIDRARRDALAGRACTLADSWRSRLSSRKPLYVLRAYRGFESLPLR